MAKIIFENLKKTVELADGSNISDVCEENGVPVPCHQGVCGGCLIQVLEGMQNFSDFTQEELDFFGKKGSERLACQCKIKSGTVKISF